MKLLINLFNPVKDFSAREEHFSRLAELYPHVEFIFANSRKEFEQGLATADAAYVWSFSEKYYSLAPNLKFIVTPAAGRDWVAEDPQGRVKVHFSSFHGPMIAESLLAMMMSLNHSFDLQGNLQRAGVWDRNVCTGRRLLRGQQVVIYGMGRIGLACARLLQALGMRVVGVNRSGFCEGSEGIDLVTVSEAGCVLGQADHVVLLLPGDKSNTGIINDVFFKSLKPGVRLYNFGRGSVVDEVALLTHLNSRHINAAGLDVTAVEPLPQSSPLYTHPRVLLTPHNSCTYSEYIPLFVEEQEMRLGELLAEI